MSHIAPRPPDSSADPRRDPTTDELWAAAHAALKARDMPAVVAILHPLAVRDPRGVELFMAVLAVVNSEPAE